MNDLPSPSASTKNIPVAPSSPIPTNVLASGGGSGKEKEGIGIGNLEAGLRDVSGQEMEVPKEVVNAGVKVTPTSISVPPKISQLGVKPSGPNVPLGTGATVTLPLTDDQIAVGLHQSLTSSWRWLAQWCLRRLMQLHLVLKNIHGRLVRVPARQ